MNCPNCNNTLIELPSALFGGEALQQCQGCGRLWDEEELSQAEEPAPGAGTFGQFFQTHRQEDPTEEDEEEFAETELNNEELQDDHDVAGTEEDFIEDEEELEDDLEEVTYEDIEEDQNPYDWMGA